MREEESVGIVGGSAPALLRRISWGAILAGVVAVLAIQILLNLLGMGIGAAAMDPQDPNARAIGIGAGIWFVVAALISLFAGGWIAGYLAGVPRRADGMIHGFVTWSLATVVMFYLLTSMVGGVLGGVASTLGRTVTAAAPAAQPAGENVIERQLGPEARRYASDPQFQAFAAGVLSDGQAQPQDRQQLIQHVSEQGNLPQQQAASMVQNWERELAQARQQFMQAGERTAEALEQAAPAAAEGLGQAALWTFVGLLLGALAATGGGVVGASRTLPPAGVEPRPIRRAA